MNESRAHNDSSNMEKLRKGAGRGAGQVRRPNSSLRRVAAAGLPAPGLPVPGRGDVRAVCVGGARAGRGVQGGARVRRRRAEGRGKAAQSPDPLSVHAVHRATRPPAPRPPPPPPPWECRWRPSHPETVSRRIRRSWGPRCRAHPLTAPSVCLLRAHLPEARPDLCGALHW